MRKRRTARLVLVFFGAALAFALAAAASTETVTAQCAMCKLSAAAGGASATRALNLGSLVLLTPPVAIFCSFIVIIFKRVRVREED